MSNTLNEIESGLNMAGAVGAAVGGPIGAVVNAALPLAEGVVNSVVSEPPHQTVLSDITKAVNAAAPVITAAGSAMSPSTGSQVSSGVSALLALVTFLKSIL